MAAAGEWELVKNSRKKASSVPNGKLSKEERKNFIEKTPRVTATVLLFNDVPPPLNTTSCTNGNLLYVFIGGAQLGRQLHRDICVCSSAMATIDISCKGCEFDDWKIIAPAVPMEDSELNNN
ncbi:hypothetical protein E2C01_036492 [Portunus trituberculatus]|uniref:Uncharacterized protein n=1 Tax=Portunus trituberculatus TaxID=210409 RepID=A0A5B7F6V2_PORTR|nr:hypothetical protein [Portunus trituberculatus]